MRSSRYLCGFSLFAYLWVAVGLSEMALMTWLAADPHEVSASVGRHGGMQVVLHHHKNDHLSASYALADTGHHDDHVLDLPDRADAGVAAPVAKGVEVDKVWLAATSVLLTQIHTAFSRVTLLLPQPPPPSRNHTLAFFRTILLLI